jgi:hypothetical protein
MRRGTILVLGLLLASTAIPQTADARPRGLPGIFGVLTAPLRALCGGFRLAGRRAHHRSTAHWRAPAAAPAAVAAGAAGAAAASTTAASEPAKTSAPTTTATGGSDTIEAPAAEKTTAAAPAASSAHAEATPSDAPKTTATATPAATTDIPPAAAPIPTPAPQRSAALATPSEQPVSRTKETSRSAAPATQQVREPGQLGMTGPTAWPSAFEDVVGFALWPKDYSERLRAHGIGDVMATIFNPGGPAVRANTAKAGDPKTPEPISACGAQASSDWPSAEVERVVELNTPQRAALDEFKTSLSDAMKSIKSTCRDDAKLGPTERLRAMQNTLWAVHDAALAIRTPLAKFYDSLSDEQKKRFAAPAPDARSANMSRGDMARMCGMPSGGEMSMRQLEQNLRTNKAQQVSLGALQKKSFEMGQFLMASCLKPMPATPAERLDNAADRLTAVIFAASTMNLALNEFTSQLTDDQKSKLNSAGR